MLLKIVINHVMLETEFKHNHCIRRISYNRTSAELGGSKTSMPMLKTKSL